MPLIVGLGRRKVNEGATFAAPGTCVGFLVHRQGRAEQLVTIPLDPGLLMRGNRQEMSR